MEDINRWALERDGPVYGLVAHEESENDYRARRFRSAYYLHLIYYGCLFVFFAIGMLDDAFWFVSICLAPLFLALTMARVALHGWEDHVRAQAAWSRLTLAAAALGWRSDHSPSATHRA